jgi:hypothetical protein
MDDKNSLSKENKGLAKNNSDSCAKIYFCGMSLEVLVKYISTYCDWSKKTNDSIKKLYDEIDELLKTNGLDQRILKALSMTGSAIFETIKEHQIEECTDLFSLAGQYEKYLDKIKIGDIKNLYLIKAEDIGKNAKRLYRLMHHCEWHWRTNYQNCHSEKEKVKKFQSLIADIYSMTIAHLSSLKNFSAIAEELNKYAKQTTFQNVERYGSEEKIKIFISELGIGSKANKIEYIMKKNKGKMSKRLKIIYSIYNDMHGGPALATELSMDIYNLSKEISKINDLFKNKLDMSGDLIINQGGYYFNTDFEIVEKR